MRNEKIMTCNKTYLIFLNWSTNEYFILKILLDDFLNLWCEMKISEFFKKIIGF